MTPDGSFKVRRGAAFEVRRPGSNGLLRLGGELDMAAVDVLVQSLPPETDGDGALTLDLSDLTFIDVVGARAILEAGRDRSIVLQSPSPTVLKVLRLVGGEDIPVVLVEP